MHRKWLQAFLQIIAGGGCILPPRTAHTSKRSKDVCKKKHASSFTKPTGVAVRVCELQNNAIREYGKSQHIVVDVVDTWWVIITA